jgi:hypothetical protein
MMMGRQAGDQSQLFYLFNLEDRRAHSGAPSPAPDQSDCDARVG